MKKNRAILFLVLVVFTLSFFSGTAAGEWVLNDEGEKYWWEPPNTPIQSIPENPGIRTQTDAEVLFLMDTSGSMGDEFTMLCGKIEDIVQGLKDKGINLEYKILGITGNWYCTTGTVSGSVENPTVNHSEDWGPAVEDVANQYPWKEGYARIAIPMSDEGAENGGGSWGSDDTAAIERAKNAAKDNGVGVIPVVCSGYSQGHLDGATELADYCWGSVFKSTSDVQGFVDGITNAINQIFNPVSEKLEVQLSVDDVLEPPYTCGSINKIAGDIAFVVVEILNGDGKSHSVDLEITYPSNWSLVDHNPVMKREDLVSDEKALDTETVDTGTDGKVAIKNIEVPEDNWLTFWKDEGKSCQYIAKVIIPTDETEPYHTVTAKISAASGTSSSISQSEDAFFISIVKDTDDKTVDMVLTNRSLLIKKHSDKEKVADILREIQNVASRQKAVVFYVDWWDEYDSFAQDKDGNSINPGGTGSDVSNTPIKNWDRETVSYSSQDKANENACTPIDEYTHYWSEQLGGIDKERHLLIVGNDFIIPFFRLKDALFDDCYEECKLDDEERKCCKWYNKDGSFVGWDTYYVASEYTKNAANKGYAYSDVIYADTDKIGYVDGVVENIFVGRIAVEDADTLLETLTKSLSDRTQRKNSIVTCDQTSRPVYKVFLTGAKNSHDSLRSNNYDVNSTEGYKLIFDDEDHGGKWSFKDLKNEFKNTFDHFVFHDHGAIDEAGVKFKAKDLDKVNSDLEKSVPNMIFMGCLFGQVDRTSKPNSNLMVYSSFRNHARNMLGATTLSTNINLAVDYLNEILGGNSVGRALKEARNNNTGKACAGIYNLYGVPWQRYPTPKEASESQFCTIHRKSLQVNKTQVVTIKNVTTKMISEIIQAYDLVTRNGFDFFKIDKYADNNEPNQLAVPLRKFVIRMPKDGQVINISVSRTNPIVIDGVDIPIRNLAPPLPGSTDPEYLEAPAEIGIFNTSHYDYSYKDENNMNLTIVLYPIEYDVTKNSAKLYKEINIDVTFETTKQGVLIKFAPDKQYYSSNETINVSLSVENIIDKAVDFDATVGLVDDLGSIVQSKVKTITIDPATIAETTIQLEAPSTGGSYWVSTSVSDGNQIIGTSNEHINVNPGAITDFEIPRCVPGSTAQFSVTFKNESASEIKATFGIVIYNGSLKKAEFLPKVYNISAGAEQTANFSWDIPADFPGGDFLAVASVSSEGYATSESRELGIGNLGDGWNLISLYQQPADTSITSVLEHIMNRVESVWALINGTWYIYDPDNPGFSDLAEMTTGYGYWLNMKIGSNFSVSGSIPGKTINLISGWNLVGYNSQTEQPVADALAAIVGKVESVWTQINGEWKVYFPANSGMSDLATMAPGYGYYIKTTGVCTWTLP